MREARRGEAGALPAARRGMLRRPGAARAGPGERGAGRRLDERCGAAPPRAAPRRRPPRASSASSRCEVPRSLRGRGTLGMRGRHFARGARGGAPPEPPAPAPGSRGAPGRQILPICRGRDRPRLNGSGNRAAAAGARRGGEGVGGGVGRGRPLSAAAGPGPAARPGPGLPLARLSRRRNPPGAAPHSTARGAPRAEVPPRGRRKRGKETRPAEGAAHRWVWPAGVPRKSCRAGKIASGESASSARGQRVVWPSWPSRQHIDRISVISRVGLSDPWGSIPTWDIL